MQLSAWFAFLMYKHLRRHSGKLLYQLYWATKQQTEKGPQDAVTMDARYSLSEEKLLRASIDFRELTVFLLADSAGAICDTQVRVLNCDTIGQVGTMGTLGIALGPDFRKQFGIFKKKIKY